MSPPPVRPYEDIGGVHAAFRGTLGYAPEFLERPADEVGGASGCAAIRPRRTGTMARRQAAWNQDASAGSSLIRRLLNRSRRLNTRRSSSGVRSRASALLN